MTALLMNSYERVAFLPSGNVSYRNHNTDTLDHGGTLRFCTDTMLLSEGCMHPGKPADLAR